jgi:hypothetical protein
VNESEIDELVAIQGMEEALHVIGELDILSRPSHQEKHHNFASQLKQIRERVMAKESVGMDIINQMIVNLQDFIAELKPISQAQLEARTMRNSAEMQTLSSNVKHLSARNHRLEKWVHEEQEKNEFLNHQVEMLRANLESQKSLRESVLSMHDAQLANMRDFMKHLAKVTGPESLPEDLFAQLKKQVLSMQALLETTLHEKELSHSEAMEFESKLNAATESNRLALSEIEELRTANFELETKLKHALDRQIFYESDTQKLKLEQAIDLETKSKQQAQIQNLLAQISTIQTEILERNDEIRALQHELLIAKNAIDDLEIKVNFGHFTRKNVPHVGVATQTRGRKHVNLNAEVPGSPSSTGSARSSQSVIQPNVGVQGSILLETPTFESDIDADIPLSQVVSPLDFGDESVDGFNEFLGDLEKKKSPPLEVNEKAVSRVHAPLVIPKKRPSTALTSPKRPVQSRVLPRSKVTPSHEPTAEIVLTRRQIPRPKRTEPLPPLVPPVVPEWADLPMSLTILPLSAPLSPGPVIVRRPPPPSPIHSESPPEETLRITNIRYESPPPSSFSKSPLVIPMTRRDESPPRESVPPDTSFEDLHRIIMRLSDQTQKLQQQITDRDSVISQLSSKVARLTESEQAGRLAVIHAEETVKRARLSLANCEFRLEIVINQLNERDDEVHQLRKDMMRLRSLSEPALLKLNGLQNAREAQHRTVRQKQRQIDLASVASRALGSAANPETHKYLSSLLDNTKRSLVRLKRRRNMWKEVEKKQMIGALGALSLLQEDSAITFDTRSTSPFRKYRKLIVKKVRDDEDIPSEGEAQPSLILRIDRLQSRSIRRGQWSESSH